MAYSGIRSDSLWLLAQNRFENNKLFYDEHKELIKSGVTVPMRQIAGELSPMMYEIDEMMNLDPVKMVSRIRRDTRFTKDKHLYRDNIWTMFMRPKRQWQFHPCMWFEVSQDGISYGVGNYETTPAMMEIYRQHLIKYEDEFVDAVKSARSIGASFSADGYKKGKEGNPSPAVLPYYNVKRMCFIKCRNDFKIIETDEIIRELEKEYKAFAPMYKFLLRVSDEYVATLNGVE